MYGTLPAPTDFLGLNQHSLHPHRLRINGHEGPDSDSHSPTMSEPRSPIMRHSFSADLPSHLASLYNSPYAAAAVAAAVAGQGGGLPQSTFTPYGRAPVTSPFYPGVGGQDSWRRPAYLSQLELCWPPNFRSIDAIVGPRTKAPREATSILKNWLNEHKDNPYPTKSEKVTLSIVTHMTLTQVSTWFANARRRIKKESKITWTPKPRCNDKDENSSNEEENEKENHLERQKRSPFDDTRDYLSDERRRSIHDRDTQRDYRLSDAGSSSSLSLTSDTSHRSQASDNPMFPSFHRIQPQLYPAAAAAAAASLFSGPSAAFHRHIFPHLLAEQSMKNTYDVRKEGSPAETKDAYNYQDSTAFRLNREREKDKRSLAEEEEEDDKSREASPFGHGRYRQNDSASDKEVYSDAKDLSPSPVKEDRFSSSGSLSKSSFVSHKNSDLSGKQEPLNGDRLTIIPGKKRERQRPEENSPFGEKPLCESKGRRRFSASSCGKFSDDVSLVASPIASDSKMSVAKVKSTTPSCSSPENFQEKDENFDAISSPVFSPLHNSRFHPGGQAMVSPPGNCDVFSSWIRDFQQLVASGQANKAKQALASALAMAAKAGAYPCHSAGLSSPFHRQEHGNRSPEYRRMSASPRQLSCTNRYSPLSSSRHSSRTTSNGSSSPRSFRFSDESSKLNARGSSSRRYSDSPPANKRGLGIPRSPQDNLPINLSKSCDDWKRTPVAEEQSKVEV